MVKFNLLTENLCEVEPMEEGIVPGSPVVNTFTELLKVDGAHCLLLDEMCKPLLDLVSPISSPNVLDNRDDKIVAMEKDSAVVSAPILSDKSNKHDKVLTHTVYAEVHSESDKVTKKSEGGAVAKENVKSHNLVSKVASTCKKVNPNQRKKGFAPSVVKDNSVKRHRKTDEAKREHSDFSVEDIRMQCRPDFKIPLKSRVSNFCHPVDRYRYDDGYYDRFDGMSRGYRSMDLNRYHYHPRSCSFLSARSNRIFGLTPEERKWLENMPLGWEDR